MLISRQKPFNLWGAAIYPAPDGDLPSGAVAHERKKLYHHR